LPLARSVKPSSNRHARPQVAAPADLHHDVADQDLGQRRLLLFAALMAGLVDGLDRLKAGPGLLEVHIDAQELGAARRVGGVLLLDLLLLLRCSDAPPLVNCRTVVRPDSRASTATRKMMPEAPWGGINAATPSSMRRVSRR
jgi:hypothetical protein